MNQSTTMKMHFTTYSAVPRFLTVALLLVVVASSLRAGDLTIDGNLAVTSNLTVNGSVTGITAAKVGAVTAAQATNICQSVIAYIPAMGDISMGSFTNAP